MGAEFWLPYAIKGGADIFGAKIGADAQGKAGDQTAAAIQKGIDLQRQMYEQDRADMAPYRGLGAGAVGNLAYLSGIDMPAAATPPPTQNPQAPQESLAQLGANPNTTSTWGNVLRTSVDRVNQANDAMNSGKLGPTIKVSKNGQTRVIPSTLLPKALAEGFQQVQ